MAISASTSLGFGRPARARAALADDALWDSLIGPTRACEGSLLAMMMTPLDFPADPRA